MRDSSILGFLAGVIVLLLIVVFSLGYQLNKAHKYSSREKSLRIKAEERVDSLEKEKGNLLKKIENLENQLNSTKEVLASKEKVIGELKLEIEKLKRLKAKLEENLSEELIKRDTP
ncbi:MAG: hypothetical protein J7K37_05280 [Candidatus Omnitrophica bacterium]|nr:hypothetical protein [Candidatus Omnitrophota bacterium]